VQGDPGRDASAGTADRQVFLQSEPRLDPAFEDLPGPPPLGIVVPLHSFPGTLEHAPPPEVPSAPRVPISPTVPSAEVVEEPNPASPTPSIPGAGDRNWNAFWVDFLPALAEHAEAFTSAVAISPESAGETQAIPEEPAPSRPAADLLAAGLPYGAGFGSDDLGFWLLAGALAAVGCEVARRRRLVREQLGLVAADDTSLRWFPEVTSERMKDEG
jgi:hypothetical protein